MNLLEIPEYAALKENLKDLPDNCSYYRGALLTDFARSLEPVKTTIEQLRETYPGCWPSSQAYEDVMKFSLSRSFDSREEFLAFIKANEMTLPKDVIKSGRIRDEKPITTMIYSFTHDNINFNLSYDRDGFPTKHCKVVVNTSYDIACDISGNDSEE